MKPRSASPKPRSPSSSVYDAAVSGDLILDLYAPYRGGSQERHIKHYIGIRPLPSDREKETVQACPDSKKDEARAP